MLSNCIYFHLRKVCCLVHHFSCRELSDPILYAFSEGVCSLCSESYPEDESLIKSIVKGTLYLSQNDDHANSTFFFFF